MAPSIPGEGRHLEVGRWPDAGSFGTKRSQLPVCRPPGTIRTLAVRAVCGRSEAEVKLRLPSAGASFPSLVGAIFDSMVCRTTGLEEVDR